MAFHAMVVRTRPVWNSFSLMSGTTRHLCSMVLPTTRFIEGISEMTRASSLLLGSSSRQSAWLNHRHLWHQSNSTPRVTEGYCFSPLFGLLSASRDFAALHQ
jgi:hypothetical protein